MDLGQSYLVQVAMNLWLLQGLLVWLFKIKGLQYSYVPRTFMYYLTALVCGDVQLKNVSNLGLTAFGLQFRA